MYTILPILNFSLATAGLFLMIVTVALYLDHFFIKSPAVDKLLKPFLWPIIILTSVGTVALTLIYSEYFRFVPCSMCWLQRIAMYPQALMAVLAWQMMDKKNFPMYGIALSVFGLLVASYQYLYQMMPKESLANGLMPCLVDGTNADCAVKVIDEFGFVTFPLISAVTFAFLIILYLKLRRS